MDSSGPSTDTRGFASPNTKKGGGVHCIAPGCTNYFYKEGDKQHFHRLPLKNKALLKNWLQKIKRKDPPVNEYARVCSDHFEPECYRQKRSFDSSGALVSNATKHLCTDAVPTIFNLSAFSSGMCDTPATTSSVEKTGERKRRLAIRTRKQQHTEVGLFTSYLPKTVTGSISQTTVYPVVFWSGIVLR